MLLPAPVPVLVDDDGGHDDDALDDILDVGVDAEEGEAAHHHAQDQRADHRAGDPADPAREADAADHRRRDRVQLVGHPHAGLARGRARRGDDPAQPREQARDRVDHHQVPADVDARDPRRLHVAADRVGVLAVLRVAQRDVEDDRNRDEDQHRSRARADPGVLVRQHADRLAVRVVLGEATGRHHHAERGDEGRDVAVGRERAVDQAGHQPDAQARRDWDQRRHAGERGEDGAGVARLLRQAGRDHGREGHDRARGEVDAAGDDHLRHADRQQARHRDLQDHDQQQLWVAEEALVPDRPAQELKDHRDPDQHQEDAGLRRQGAAPPGRAGGGGGDVACYGSHDGRSSSWDVQPRFPDGPAYFAASAMTFSWVASARLKVPLTWPSCMTMTRSDMPRTSGSSEEIMTIAMPLAARSETSRCTSAFAPTSMPRVGSSRISTLGLVIRQRAIRAFCWLPPERLPTVSWRSGVLIRSCSFIRSQVALNAPWRTKPPAVWVRTDAICMFSSTECMRNSPVALRSSVSSASPCSIATLGEVTATGLPPRRISPPVAGVTPKMVSATLVRPAPTRPAKPRISPRRSSNETPRKTPSSARSRTSSATSPISASPFGNIWVSSRPTMRAISFCWLKSAAGPVATYLPSRNTERSSAMRNTSAILWVM